MLGHDLRHSILYLMSVHRLTHGDLGRRTDQGTLKIKDLFLTLGSEQNEPRGLEAILR
jgi:hypothetical protein